MMNNKIKSLIVCNLCNSSQTTQISLKDRDKKYLRTVICKECGLIWSDPRPEEKEIQEFYSKKYRKEYKGIIKPKKKHVYRDSKEAIKRYEFFKDIISKNDKLLDIGAGNGVFVACMKEIGINAKGIDPDQNHAKYARQELKAPVETGFASQIKTKQFYNIITLHHVLEHLIDPFIELKNIHSMLAKDGYLVLEVPNAQDLKQNPKNRYHKAHLYTFNLATLSAIGIKAGFNVVRQKTARLNGNISMIFQKNDTSDLSLLFLSKNYSNIVNLLNKYNIVRHFLSYIPYFKFFSNIYNSIAEQISIMRYEDDRDIVRSVSYMASK